LPPVRAAVAEFIGTFALTFVGGAAIVVTQGMDSSLVAVALAHGLILSVMVSATMHISGGQLNPAVAIALAAVRKQPPGQAAVFVMAQLLGAVCAAALIRAAFENAAAVNFGATLGSLSSTASNAGLVVALEVVATFFLMFVIMGTAVDQRGVGGSRAVGGFGIGLTVAANILAIGPLTGASMNPARSFGPALIGGAWDMHWVYWVAPMLGAVAAAAVYRAVFSLDRPSAASTRSAS
jgi:aquaporin TIP